MCDFFLVTFGPVTDRHKAMHLSPPIIRWVISNNKYTNPAYCHKFLHAKVNRKKTYKVDKPVTVKMIFTCIVQLPNVPEMLNYQKS